MFAFMRKLSPVRIDPTTFKPKSLPFTPDLPELEEKDFWWMFTPDESQPGHHMDWLMDPAKSAYEAFTAAADYVLWRKYLRLKTVAVPLQADAMPYLKNMRLNGQPMYPSARLKGHLFSIRPNHFLELDEYKQNGVAFVRRRINVLIPYSTLTEIQIENLTKSDDGKLRPTGTYVPSIQQDRHVHRIQAWMYEGNPDFWKTLGECPQFMPSNPIKSRLLGKMSMPYYYHFTQKDYSVEKVKAPAIINGHEQNNNQQTRSLS